MAEASSMNPPYIKGFLDRLIEKLEEASEKWGYHMGYLYFCIDCQTTYDPIEDSKHDDHTITYTDVDHDGIGEWVKALKWVKKEVLNN
jgi:hypothetical protein